MNDPINTTLTLSAGTGYLGWTSIGLIVIITLGILLLFYWFYIMLKGEKK